MNAPATETIEFAEEELAGKLLQVVVAQLEGQREPWSKVSEEKQAIALNAMSQAVEEAVRNAVHVIASDHRTVLSATVESVTFKDGVKAVLTLLKSQGAHDLADAEGSTALVIVGALDKFTGGTEKMEAAPGQGSLGLTEPDREPEDDAPESPPAPKEEPVPEVLKEGKVFVIVIGRGEDRTRYPGSPASFKSAARAEDWLQKHLNEKEAHLIKEALEAFAEAGNAEGKKPEDDRNYDAVFQSIAAKFPTGLIEDNYTEVSAAFADGYEKAIESE